jgi:GR25 family glycosyltransferase involved in LPS biosynthesis
MIELADVIDEAYVVNLDSRPERWERARKELEEAGLSPTRFSAVDGSAHPERDRVGINPGALGCSLSHLNVFARADREGHGTIAVFEDDVVLEDGFGRRFDRAWRQIPEEWQVCYLGGFNKRDPEPISDNIGRCTRTFSTHAYLITPRGREVIREGHRLDQPIDVLYTRLQEENTWHIMMPRLALQRPGESDITGRREDYTHLHKDL